MKIQIDGVGTHNKGAELMLRAILQHFEPHNATISVGKGNIKPQEYAALNLVKNPQPPVKDQLLYLLLGYASPAVKKCKVGLLIDSSGFKYGDFWDNSRSWGANFKESVYLRFFKKLGTRIIFLPQAFGPFSTPKSKYRIRNIVRNADLVFYRDMSSKEFLEAAIKPGSLREKMQFAPDFTASFSQGKERKETSNSFKRVGIIPNCKMLESDTFKSMEVYIDFLNKLVAHYQQQGLHVSLINHTGSEDQEVIKQLYQSLPNTSNVSLVSNDNALALKDDVGACDFIVASRFHGVINALSQAIPTICLGWSHKYQRIMEDYNVFDYYVQLDTNEKMLENIKRLSTEAELKSAKGRIESRRSHWFTQIANMWSTVDKSLN
ncbi:polysaccharide pyruvyl transferase family protein [Paraflavitalea pollutisoli]|uniref:polysaccharide pyruvyl transferase family protein n=1 Tax=Paraflavitalea pollutisoli TaxID=3034143 RepID=UPI0023EAE20E|nr:polysaccharide pyruvyl transferase family protein [Paraflavitalea sp. H1-2-19X]